jgi:hypothetical protein
VGVGDGPSVPAATTAAVTAVLISLISKKERERRSFIFISQKVFNYKLNLTSFTPPHSSAHNDDDESNFDKQRNSKKIRETTRNNDQHMRRTNLRTPLSFLFSKSLILLLH